jgi:hypothetical protein
MEAWLVQFLNSLTPTLARVALRRSNPHGSSGWLLGTVLGAGADRDTPSVVLQDSELDRHVYVLGASGAGKSKLLELLIRQHIQQRAGFCLIDPHGDLTSNVMAYLWDESRRGDEDAVAAILDRVYLVEPFRSDGVVGLNPLDPGGAPLYPHIADLVAIFRRFWASSWGPRMEECWRNCLLALALTGNTLTEVSSFLTDPAFRSQTLGRVADEAVLAYWHGRYEPLTDAMRSAVAEPVLNKVGALLADPRLRCMLGQTDHCLNLRQLMDEGAWLFFNCAKGQLRDTAYLVGSLVVAQLQAAAMSRADLLERDRQPFTVFVDEFQHFRSDDFETILCEARKYRLRLVLAHQHLAQIDAALQNAIFGNAATHVFFAVSPHDTAIIARELADGPAVAQTLVHAPLGQALVHRRGQASVRNRIFPVLTPPVDDQVLSQFMAAIRQRLVCCHGSGRQGRRNPAAVPPWDLAQHGALRRPVRHRARPTSGAAATAPSAFGPPGQR